MNKYLQIIRNLNKEIQIKWWLLKHYRSLINRIIALKQTTPLTLIGTILNKLFKIIIYGKTEQDGEPTPENPVEIKNVEGSIEFKVENSDGTEEQTAPFTFEEGQYLAEGGYLADDGIHNNRNKIVFDGSSDENWNMTITSRFYITINDMKANTNTGLCDYFTTKNLSSENGITFGYGNTQNVYIFYDQKTSTSDFKTWLSNNPITVLYPLATETITQYTPTQQAQWNAIKDMYTYKDQTNINVLANLDGIEIDIGYYGTNVLTQETLDELSNGRGE